MAAMKNMVTDICYSYRDGLTIEQIADKWKIDEISVIYCIDNYYHDKICEL